MLNNAKIFDLREKEYMCIKNTTTDHTHLNFVLHAVMYLWNFGTKSNRISLKNVNTIRKSRVWRHSVRCVRHCCSSSYWHDTKIHWAKNVGRQKAVLAQVFTKYSRNDGKAQMARPMSPLQHARTGTVRTHIVSVCVIRMHEKSRYKKESSLRSITWCYINY